jgi:hypothetical protein
VSALDRPSPPPDRQRWLLLLPAIVGLSFLLVLLFRSAESEAVDVYAYLAAGERLNAGHDLYALSPGDRPVALKPPYWTVPLLSPPLIAVVWRPLALLPNELGLVLWWTASIAAVVVSVVLLYERRRWLTAAFVAVLAIPLTVLMGVGNLDASRILATLWLWHLVRDGRVHAATALLGPMIVLKATPAVLAVWLAVRRPVTVLSTTASTALSLGISVLGAGLAAHVRYLEVASTTYQTGTYGLSIAGAARALGAGEDLARFAQYGVTGILVVAVALLARQRPALSFSLAVATTAIAAPAGGYHTFAILLACLAPLAWPYPTPVASRDEKGPSQVMAPETGSTSRAPVR